MEANPSTESRHISMWIHRSARDVYRYASDLGRISEWAAGLAQGKTTRVGDSWVLQSPMGEVAIQFTPANDLGVLDHTVTLPSGERVFNPLRVVPAGGEWSCGEWSEVVFTLRRAADVSDDDFQADVTAVSADLMVLKQILEGQIRHEVCDEGSAVDVSGEM